LGFSDVCLSTSHCLSFFDQSISKDSCRCQADDEADEAEPKCCYVVISCASLQLPSSFVPRVILPDGLEIVGPG